ncbi:hypothetical protein RSAG8_06842, partial [Rhizoctonia solani AG-8 WAC10335]
MFISTVDLKRTGTYLGCIAVQAIANFCFTNLIVSEIALSEHNQHIFSFEFRNNPRPEIITFGISMLLTGLCSLCLLFITLRPVFTQIPGAGEAAMENQYQGRVEGWRFSTKTP